MHLYLHVPFCARRCSYCDFAIAVRRDVPTDAYVRRRAPGVGRDGRTTTSWAGSQSVDTIYFGGGTPSRLDPGGIAAHPGAHRIGPAGLALGAEVTLEANPDDVTPAAGRGLARPPA